MCAVRVCVRANYELLLLFDKRTEQRFFLLEIYDKTLSSFLRTVEAGGQCGWGECDIVKWLIDILRHIDALRKFAGGLPRAWKVSNLKPKFN